jgi:hypothetical protein
LLSGHLEDVAPFFSYVFHLLLESETPLFSSCSAFPQDLCGIVCFIPENKGISGLLELPAAQCNED